MSHQHHFGKFHHIGEFLDYYKKWENNKQLDDLHAANEGNVTEQINALKKRGVPDVVEVEATIRQSFGDQHQHYQFYIQITKLVTPSTDKPTNDDVNHCIQQQLNVFLAVRYGDNEGLSQPIQGGINPGDPLHLKGQWITAANAYSQNGDKMSVLHFTHHPIGFICTAQKCYS